MLKLIFLIKVKEKKIFGIILTFQNFNQIYENIKEVRESGHKTPRF